MDKHTAPEQIDYSQRLKSIDAYMNHFASSKATLLLAKKLKEITVKLSKECHSKE